MENLKKAYVAGGCFWGMEDLFRVRPGVKDTEVGYLGGAKRKPDLSEPSQPCRRVGNYLRCK